MQPQIDALTSEAHEAIIACLQIAARRGRAIREERERKEKGYHPLLSGAGDSQDNTSGTNLEVCTDAKQE